jgi:hypothetical protein
MRGRALRQQIVCYMKFVRMKFLFLVMVLLASQTATESIYYVFGF